MYLISSDQIIHETIDGETMIVNLIEGSYYSTVGSGGVVWQMVVNGNSIEDCIDVCQKKYKSESRDVIAGAVQTFISELLKEGLILNANSEEGQQSTDQAVISPTKGDVFSVPVLHKYSDMQDLLLLDPIHDVDDSGWPHPKNV